VLSAARAVAVIRPAERCRHLESNATAKARAVKRMIRAWLSGHDRGRR
jgi:alkyl hydroperoxide reductase subunit AhpC